MGDNVIIIDKMPRFKSSLNDVLNDALREGARDILIDAKTKAPFKKGGLRSDTETKGIGKLKWQVSFFKEYARFQEFGGDSKRKVRNYSTPGTGKAYLKNAGDNVSKNRMLEIIKKHLMRARV